MTVTVTKSKFNLRDTLNSLKKQTGLVGEQVMRAETATEFYNVVGQNRNILINGSVDIWQRGTAWTGGSDNDLYTADRWHFQRYAANSASISRQSALDNAFNYCIRVGRATGDTGSTAYYINQPVEGLNSKRCLGKWVTFSYWIRTGSAHQPGTYFTSSIVYHTDAAYQNDGMYYNNFRSAAPSSVSSDLNLLGKVGTVWKRFEQITYIPTGAVQVGVAIGSAGHGTATSNDYFEITGLQLEIGNVATPFEHRLFGAELALCHRYYQVIEQVSWNQGQASRDTATISFHGQQLHSPMRIAPTVATYDNSGNAYSCYRYGPGGHYDYGLWNSKVTAIGNISTQSFWFQTTFAGDTVYESKAIRTVANAGFTMSAEL